MKRNIPSIGFVRELCRVKAFYCQTFLFTAITTVGKIERKALILKQYYCSVKKISKAHVSSLSMETVHFPFSTILVRVKVKS